MNTAEYIERSQKDFSYILKSFHDNVFVHNNGFTEKANNDLEEIIVTDILLTKLEEAPQNTTVINLHSIQDISVQQKNPFLSCITKKKGFIEVKITAIVDYYWLVDGIESAIPHEVDKNGIRKNAELSFFFRYREEGNCVILAYYEDDNGCDFGESRTWEGKPDLMKKYREDPSIINAKTKK